MTAQRKTSSATRTPQDRAANARRALMTKTARKYENKYAESLRLIGYTVTPPADDTNQGS